ncbi:MAG: hypothetical protein KJ674_04730 [Nanoarchaeota archaeon]|nr:hypothetical protein [Nanoarchaeota archaeon]
MNKDKILETIKTVKNSKKRKFTQTFDVIINLKDLNLKKQEENVDSFVVLPHPKGKNPTICALINKNLADKTKIFDNALLLEKFPQEEKEKKKLADSYDIFLAQADIMPKIASAFGKVLGPKGKMPNPKLGCVISLATDLEALKKKLQNTVRLKTNKELTIKVAIGNESMSDNDLLDNFMAVHNNLIHALPKAEQNINNIYLKLTMGKPFKIGEKDESSRVREEKE